MADIQPGFTYSDVAGAPNNNLNAQNLHELVGNAVILPAFISAKALKSPAALSDAIVINDGGVLKYTTLQQLHDLILYPGSTVQTKYAEYTAFELLTAVIPWDNTVPQITEGTQIISLSITPRFATSTILCRFQGWSDANPNTANIVAIFRDSNVNAIAAMTMATAAPGWNGAVALEFMDSPATISPVTYTIRAGPGVAGNFYFNGATFVGPLLGGSGRATLVLEEIKV